MLDISRESDHRLDEKRSVAQQNTLDLPKPSRQALRARAIVRDPIRGEHYGQRPPSEPHQKAGHMAAPTRNVQKSRQNSCQTVHTWREGEAGQRQ